MKLHTFRVNADFILQRKQFDGRSHLVVPAVLMVEGVHHAMNSQPLYYSAAVLSHIPEIFNDTASLVEHPVDSNGNPISANSVVVHENQVIGRLFNTHFEHPALKSEIWIDEEKAKVNNPEFIEALERGDRIDVSTGVFVLSNDTKGTWNGEDYEGEVIYQWPDHLALLPGGEGACNWKDGCGIRNQGAKNMNTNIRSNARTPVYQGTEEMSFFDMPTSFEDFRNGYYVHTKTPLPEVLPDWIDEAPPEMKTWIAERTLLGDENAEFLDLWASLPVVNPSTNQLNRDALSRILSDRIMEHRLPLEVVQSVRQQALSLLESEFNADISTVSNSGDEGLVTKMLNGMKNIFANKDDCGCKTTMEVNKMDKKEKISKLIENGVFPEDRRKELEAMDDQYIDKFVEFSAESTEEPSPEQGKEKAVKAKVSTEAVEEEEEEKEMTAEEYIQKAPPEVREPMEQMLSAHNAQKDELVKSLVANKSNKFSEEYLKGQSLEVLRNMAELAQVEVDYSLKGNLSTSKKDDETEVPKPLRLFEKKAANE